MAIGMVLIPIGDALAKLITSYHPYSAGFLAWSRFVVGAICLLPLAMVRGEFKGLGSTFYLRQAVRGALIAATITLIIRAVQLSPLADVFGAFFIGPVVATLLAVVWLREVATPPEWLAVILGFAGVLLVVQPGVNVSSGLLFALGAGLFYGSFLVATRWASHTGPPLAQLAAQLGFGFLFLAPLGFTTLATHWQAGSLPTSGLLVLMGITSFLANFFTILGLARARAAYLAPIVYLQLVAATIIGAVFFRDQPDTLALCGVVLILLTGLLKLPAVTERWQASKHHQKS